MPLMNPLGCLRMFEPGLPILQQEPIIISAGVAIRPKGAVGGAVGCPEGVASVP